MIVNVMMVMIDGNSDDDECDGVDNCSDGDDGDYSTDDECG